MGYELNGTVDVAKLAVPTGPAPGAPQCCDLHGRNCEQGGEECCERCTEAHHFAVGHGGVPRSSPNLSGYRDTRRTP